MTALMSLDIVTAEKGRPVTNSLAIAQGSQVTHKAVLQLCKTHINSLELFGGVAFEMRPFITAGGRQVRRVAILNEAQATLLMTLLKNTQTVVSFKVALVRAFFEARALINHNCMDLIQEHAALCNAYNSEKDHASYHGKGLSDWRGKRDNLQAAITKVESQLQPLLTNFVEV